MSELHDEALGKLGDVDEPTIDEFYEHATCGYLSLLADGTIVRVNQTFLDWTGLERSDLLGGQRFAALLTVGARVYYETHCAPMLATGLDLREIALDVRRVDGAVLPALVGAHVLPGAGSKPTIVRITVFDASHRRGFERQLLAAREAERRGRTHAEALTRLVDRLGQLDNEAQIGTALAGELTGGGFAERAELIRRVAGVPRAEAVYNPADGDITRTIGLIPVSSSSGIAFGTLQVELDTVPDEDVRVFFGSVAVLVARALERLQRTVAARPSSAGGLPNERWWASLLKAEMQRAASAMTPLTVVVVEVSQLEQVTMGLGVGAGDQLLLGVIDAWRQEGFDVLSRLGGEEFAVLMPGLDEQQARSVVGRVARTAGARRRFVAGVAQWDRVESAAGLVNRAESALVDR